MHDCRLGFPAIALWIADQHEGRPEHITTSTPRLTAEEQEERRSIDAQRTKELDPADVLQAHESRQKEVDEKLAKAGGWMEWKGGAVCPIPIGTMFQVMFRGSDVPSQTVIAPLLAWDHQHNGGDIIFYRVVPQ